MNKTLLLFCTTNYRNESNNTKNLISNNYNLFDNIKLLNENDLDSNIQNIISNIKLNYGNRGYGYWIWKPYLVLQELNKMNEGDILVYLDSHFKDNKLKDKFDDIVNLLNEQPIIIGRLGFNDLIFTTTKLKEHVENFLNYKFTNNQLNEIQYEGGILFIRNCKESRKFIHQWFAIMKENIKCITDYYNNDKNNHKSFRENRHDQSVVSLLYKFYNYKTPEYLTWEFMS